MAYLYIYNGSHIFNPKKDQLWRGPVGPLLNKGKPRGQRKNRCGKATICLEFPEVFHIWVWVKTIQNLLIMWFFRDDHQPWGSLGVQGFDPHPSMLVTVSLPVKKKQSRMYQNPTHLRGDSPISCQVSIWNSTLASVIIDLQESRNWAGWPGDGTTRSWT